MASKALKANIVIHTCAVTSAVAAGAWASIPLIGAFGIIFGLDTLFLTPMTIGMVIYIGKLHGHSYKYAELMAGVGQVIGMVLGINVARALAALVPGWGTGLNAAIAFGLQETIGWGAYLLLERGGKIENLGEFIRDNEDDIKKTIKQEKANAEKVEQAISHLPPDKKAEYDNLKSQFERKNLSKAQKIEIQEKMIRIVEEAMLT